MKYSITLDAKHVDKVHKRSKVNHKKALAKVEAKAHDSEGEARIQKTGKVRAMPRNVAGRRPTGRSEIAFLFYVFARSQYCIPRDKIIGSGKAG